MPHVINGVTTNGVPTGLTVMSDGDGPGIKAADIEPALQGLLDGETDLNARSIRPFATVAALQGTTNHVDGALAFVLATGGVYRYVATSAVAARTNLVITPTDVGVGVGRWTIASPYDVANGFPTLDATSKVTASVVPNRLVAALETALTTGFTMNTTAAYLDAVAVTVSGAQVGDLLVVDGSLWATIASSTGSYSLVVVDGGTPYQQEDGLNQITTVTAVAKPAALYTVLVAGTVTVKIQVKPTSAVTLTVYGNPYNSGGLRSKLRVLQYRP